ncbi:MAG: ABC transporter ATP-binding protein [Desulfococcaceae bacterium]
MRLSVDGVSFRYNSHPVLDRVTFDAPAGQVFAVLGVNGAGKSTLLRCLNRILKPHRGTVLVEKEDLSGLDRNAVARRMGYVPQRFGQTELSVFDAVLLGRKPHMQWGPEASDYEKVEAVLARMGLSEMALRPLESLSGGEAQKVIIARALVQEPKVLLLDEPTSNLDPKNQREVMVHVGEAVRRDGLCAVISIHDLNLAVRHADRLLLLRDGRVHAAVSRDQITAEMIREVYDIEVVLATVAGHPVIVPV